MQTRRISDHFFLGALGLFFDFPAEHWDQVRHRTVYTLTNLEKSERRRVEQLILSWRVLVQTYQYYV
jgi:hypothetical protein